VTPKVSLVTPSYNQVHYIERTLRSVLCQDYPDVEYLVFDGLSNDGTQDVLRRYEEPLDVLVIERDDGQADALDKGFRLASGDILGYLNADDCLASARTLSEVVRAFAAHPDVDVIYGRRYAIDGNGCFAELLPYRPFSSELLHRADYIPQEATFWRREIYERAGGYVNTEHDFAMDYELWLRFLSVGARFVSVPDVWGLFRRYPNQKSNAAWQSKGLPEVARLHERYLGRQICEYGMYNYWGEHLFGADPVFEPESYRFAHGCWMQTQWLHMRQLNGAQLDGWVHHAPLNPLRLERLARRNRASAA
jgi:glycosyltransferase involved in cell wall biosynthesis